MFSSVKKIFTKKDDPGSREPDPPAHNPHSTEPWFGVDLDGTLAVWNSRSSLDRIGPPVPVMVEQVQRMVSSGIRVKIFTARAGDPAQIPKIQAWLAQNGLGGLEITNIKDFYMERLYDDRAIRVERNTGKIIS